MEPHYYTFNAPFTLESGETLSELRLAYHTYGVQRADNVLWVCHALTANSEVADWWPHTVEQGRFLDPERYFTLCVNILGSHYGTTSPLSTDPHRGAPYYDSFPQFTIRDIARANLLLADHLGITSVEAIMGSSVGGFQAMEMVMERPALFKKLILIATSAQATPWQIALNETQRMAIESDPTYATPSPRAGLTGMATARAIALLSYRGVAAYNATQQEAEEPDKVSGFRACSYQRYQGLKLQRRFNAYSYVRISEAFDSHNIGRGRGGVAQALASIALPTLIVGVSSDLLFPTSDQQLIQQHIPNSRLEVIDSEFGHDGFLVEHEKLNNVLKPFIDK